MKCLFIGGPADGQIIDIEHTNDPYRVYTEIPLLSAIHSRPRYEGVSWAVYLPLRFIAGNFETVIYSPPETDGGMILRTLINDYHKTRR
jgi:hypothetical protein